MSSTFTDFGLLDRASDEVRSIPAGQVIINAGDPAREFFVIRRGSVVVRIGNRTIDTLGEGDVFGEMALIDAGSRSASVIAETDCQVTPVSEKQFLFMISEAPYFALSVMRVLVDRLRRANQALPGD